MELINLFLAILMSCTDSDVHKFSCESEGNFASPINDNCKLYITCERTEDNTLKKIINICPNGQVFNENSNRCSGDDECTKDSTISSTVDNSFFCKGPGVFPDVTDTENRRYHKCIQYPVDAYLQISYICKNKFTFNSNLSKCILDENVQIISTTEIPCNMTIISTDETTISVTTEELTTVTEIIPKETTESEQDFSCEKPGRFADPKDKTCKDYYLCIRSSNGFLQVPYTCDSDTFFDPLKGQCSITYSCGTNIISTTEMPSDDMTVSTDETTTENIIKTTEELTTTTENIPEETTESEQDFSCEKPGRFANPKDKTCKDYYLCIRSSNGFLQVPYTCDSDTFFDPLKGQCSITYSCETNIISTTEMPSDDMTVSTDETTTENIIKTTEELTTTTENIPEETTESEQDFSCEKPGRFANPKDKTCKDYYLCIRSSTGFLQVPYTCDSDTFFDPLKGQCSITYSCETNIISTTEMPSDDMTVSTDETTTENIIKTTEELTTTTESIPEETTEFEQEFSCEKPGRFANPKDKSCKDYYLCIRSSNGFLQVPYTCDSDTYFDPLKGQCSITYSCETNIISTTEMPSDDMTVSTDETSTENIIKTTEELTTTTESIPEETTESEQDFSCEKPGRFANPKDKSCKDYYLCIRSSTGFLQVPYTCDSDTFFDPLKGQCSITYSCETNIISTTEMPSDDMTVSTDETTTENIIKTTEELTTTTENIPEETTEFEQDFSCEKPGRFANPKDKTCKDYYLCIRSSNGFLQVPYTCDSDTFFDPLKGQCSITYSCETNIISTTEMPSDDMTVSTDETTTENIIKTTEELTTTTENIPEETTESEQDFSCEKPGRFADPKDKTCKDYYLCIRSSTGFLQVPYTCDSDTFFDPLKGQCSITYSCETNIISTTEMPSDDMTVSTDETTTENIIKTTEELTTTTESIPEETTESEQDFSCEKPGRFANPKDKTCKDYYLCIRSSNGFLQVPYTCDSDTFFHPIKGQCSITYICQSNIISTIEIHSYDEITIQNMLKVFYSKLAKFW